MGEVKALLLSDVAEPEGQADIRRRLEFDAAMRAIAGRCVGRGVERRERVADAGVEFQGVDTAIDPERRAARLVLEVVAELYALVGERADIAERATLAEAVHAETHGAAFAADKPAVRKIGARIGKAVASGTEVKARKVAVAVQALDAGRIAAEAEGAARDPVAQRGDLGVGRLPAQAERHQSEYET